MRKARETPKHRRRSLDRLLREPPRAVGAAGRNVLRFIAQNPEAVLASSAADIADRTGTSDATVIRTAQALGFAGLAELKQAILESLTPASVPADNMRRMLADLAPHTNAALDAVLDEHRDALAAIASPAGRAALTAAVSALNEAARIVVFGIGPSAAVATYAARMLARIGRRSRTLDVTGAMLADELLDLAPGDALLILAYGRLYPEVTAVFGEAKAMGLPTVLLTEALDTPPAKLADVVIAAPRGRPGHMALHGATLVALESLILSLSALRPEHAIASLDRLGDLRRGLVSR